MTHDPREALEPCPFCGSQPSFESSDSGCIIKCTDDGCWLNQAEVFEWSDDDAARRWNTRALTASPGEQKPVAWRMTWTDGSYTFYPPDWSPPQVMPHPDCNLVALYTSPPPAAGIIEREIAAQSILARVRRVRDGYANQAKFADVDQASYFREFVRRLDDAVNPKPSTSPWNGKALRREAPAPEGASSPRRSIRERTIPICGSDPNGLRDTVRTYCTTCDRLLSEKSERQTDEAALSNPPAAVEINASAEAEFPAWTEEDKAYELGRRDGYELAVQDIDLATGGDGEFKGSTLPGETVDVPTMKQRIIDRFAANASAEARLREALQKLKNEAVGILALGEAAMRQAVGNTNVNCLQHWIKNAEEAISAVGDEAKKSEGCICQNQHRRGYCTEPGCPYASPAPSICETCQGNGEIVKDWDAYLHPASLEAEERSVAECPDCDGEGSRPSDPSADRREIVAQAICCPEGCIREDDCWAWSSETRKTREKQVDAILAALDGGAGA